MQQRYSSWLVAILLIAAGALYVVLPSSVINFNLGNLNFNRSQFRQGLDLQGGIQVLLEADLPEGADINTAAMETAKSIVEQRVNGLGVSEPTIQTQGERRDRIVVELPGFTDPEQAIATIKQTGLLEFVIIPSGELPPAPWSRPTARTSRAWTAATRPRPPRRPPRPPPTRWRPARPTSR